MRAEIRTVQIETIGIREHLGIAISGRHTALGDARAAAEIFLHLLELGQGQDMRTLGDALTTSLKARRLRRLQRRF